MGQSSHFLDLICEESKIPQKHSLKLDFPLWKYGYRLEGILNNENRWHTKIVCSIQDEKSLKRFVSTTYQAKSDYFRLIETTTLLKLNNKLTPQMTSLYPQANTVVCGYIGEFLSSYLMDNPADIVSNLVSVFKYLKEINLINQSYKPFVTPFIIKTSLELSEELAFNFEFLPKVRVILPKLEASLNKFTYGCGIEDTHIWNFRIAKISDGIQAFTTDFDYFSDNINCFWELGYFYATLRWLKKISLSLATEAENILLSLVQEQDLKSEFMFWLGALSSYCGYKDSLRNSIASGGIAELEEQYRAIKQLDEKVSYLADRIMSPPILKQKYL